MDTFWEKLFHAHKACTACPSPADVGMFFTELLGVLFPDFSQHTFNNVAEFESHVEKLSRDFEALLTFQQPAEAKIMTQKFFAELPSLYDFIQDDVTAMYEGDPAAKTRSEIVRTYPGFYAIAAYRIAHVLLKMGVNGLPRIITEHAHSKTGIDIHPGAVIGRHFCIDHGTGIVIGETTLIGSNVKLYQGVTLGALSVSKTDAEKKRHPTLQDNIVVYAGATILGGDTVIGHDSIIGGNVWLTRSVPPYSKIYYQAKMYRSGEEESDVVIFRTDKD